MKQASYTINDLFLQLGLPNDDASIALFIKNHRMDSKEMITGKLPAKTPAEITKAPWWTPVQAEFLREAIEKDADWAIPVDKLNTLLQKEQI